jgi:hypothetical protein
MAGYSNIFINQNETFITQLTLTDSNGNPYNLTTFSIASSARRSYFSANTLINFTVSIINANNGIIQLSANAATTANIVSISGANMVYDVLLKDPASNNITRVLEGQVIVNPGVTYYTAV